MRTFPHSAWAWLPPILAVLMFALIGASGSNRDLFLALNVKGQALGNALWANLTVLGDGAVALALVLPWIKRTPERFWAALIAAVVATAYVQVIKHAVPVPRPLAVLVPGTFHHSGPPHRTGAFPSGHAAAVFALAGIWVMGLRGRVLLKMCLLLLASLVSLSRVMVGVHWPLDLLAGMLGGWLAAWCGLGLSGRLGWKTTSPWGLVSGLVLLVVAAGLIFSPHIGFPEVMPLQRAVGAVCLVWGGWELWQMPFQLPVRGRAREE